MAKKVKNFDTLQQRDRRDVYESQQLERGKRPEKQSPTSRIVAAVIFTLLVGLLVYILTGFIEMGMDGFSSMLDGGGGFIGASQMESPSGGVPDLRNVAEGEEGYQNNRFYRSLSDFYSANGYTYNKNQKQMTYFDPNFEERIVSPEQDTVGEGGLRWVHKETGEMSITPPVRPVTTDELRSVRVEHLGPEFENVETEAQFAPFVQAYDEGTDVSQVVVPTLEEVESNEAQNQGTFGTSILSNIFKFSLWRLLVSLAAAFIAFGIMYTVLMRNLATQNLLADTSDINQYENDQHIMLPDEVIRTFDIFPNVGAHSSVMPSSMISHIALSNKGLKNVDLVQRYERDILDEDGDVIYYKGEVMEDDDGNLKVKSAPLIDEKFMQDLFDASGADKSKTVRRPYDSTKYPYNPDGSQREKLGKYNTLADVINDDWILPEYEPQRPSGAYIVDVEPVNTMVLAITRAGKGQTYIEPMIDMWTRERNPNNMVINDPKGELLVKNYVRATVRGFEIIQINLINAMKTDIYNRASRSILKRYCTISA